MFRPLLIAVVVIANGVRASATNAELADLISENLERPRFRNCGVKKRDNYVACTTHPNSPCVDKRNGFCKKKDCGGYTCSRRLCNKALWCLANKFKDCNGVKGGRAVTDVCGVCGGDGTTCLGCDGVANSGKKVDKCGICDSQKCMVIESGVLKGFKDLPECKPINCLDVPDSIESIADNAFYKERQKSRSFKNFWPSVGKLLVKLYLGDKVKTIGKNAFTGNSLRELNIGDSVTTIGDRAFYDNKFKMINIGNSVTTIGKEAFYTGGNQHLECLTIGSSVTSIGDYAFSNGPSKYLFSNPTCSWCKQAPGKIKSVTIPASTKLGKDAMTAWVKINRGNPTGKICPPVPAKEYDTPTSGYYKGIVEWAEYER